MILFDDPGARGNLGDRNSAHGHSTWLRLLEPNGRVEVRLVDIAGLVRLHHPVAIEGDWIQRLHATPDVIEFQVLVGSTGYELRLRHTRPGLSKMTYDERLAIVQDMVDRAVGVVPQAPKSFALRIEPSG